MSTSLWELGVAAIVAREVFEAVVIIDSYRTLIAKSDLDDSAKAQKRGVVTKSAVGAVGAAFAVCAIVGFILAAAGSELDGAVVELIEGISKIVAAFAVGQLSLKIPKWMGLYGGKRAKDPSMLADGSLFFNVAWNLFREFGEIGVFLIPFFLSGSLATIAVSSLAGFAIAIVLALVLELLSRKMDMKPLGIFFTVLLGMLSIGLFTGGCHELEEVYGESPVVYRIPGDFWNHKKFPMVLVKPFGYSDHPTVVSLTAFWVFTILLGIAHYVKFTKGGGGSTVEEGEKAADIETVEKSVNMTATDTPPLKQEGEASAVVATV